MCYHLCYVRSKFKKVFTSPFLLGKELKRWQQFQTKRWKSMNKTQKTSWWSPRSKKGWRGRGEGIVIRIFWSTELNDPLLDKWSFKIRWFFQNWCYILRWSWFCFLFLQTGPFCGAFPCSEYCKMRSSDIMPGIPLFLHQSNLQASTLNFQEMQLETSIFLVFGRTTSAGKQDLPQVTILLQLHEAFWSLLKFSSRQIRGKNLKYNLKLVLGSGTVYQSGERRVAQQKSRITKEPPVKPRV